MEFEGTFVIEDVSPEEVWLSLSDPYMIKQSLPGCQFLSEAQDPDDVDFEGLREAEPAEDPPLLPEADPDDVAARGFEEGGHYATLLELKVGAVKPSFKTVGTVEEWTYPAGAASGEGSASGSSFEGQAEMELSETEEGVEIAWRAEADVFGRIAQMGQRVINPVADRVVSRFFSNIEDQLTEVAEEEESGGLRDRIKGMF